VREHLNHDLTAVDQVDLSAEQLAEAYGRVDNHLRVAETRRYLRAMLAGDPSGRQLLRHPMTSLEVGGVAAYLEADALSFIVGGQLTTVEVKSFAAIDGLPDPAKSAAALSQAAVYIVSLQHTVADLGFDPRRVSSRVLLVLTRDFGLTPAGSVALAAGLAAGLELPALPTKNALLLERQTASRKAADVVSAIPCRFGDSCISCPLFRYCRDEARTADEVTAVGSAVAEACGDVGTVRRALSLARGGSTPARPVDLVAGQRLTSPWTRFSPFTAWWPPRPGSRSPWPAAATSISATNLWCFAPITSLAMRAPRLLSSTAPPAKRPT
jgi:hypothetical protein